MREVNPKKCWLFGCGREKFRITLRSQVWTARWMEVQFPEIRSETRGSGSGRKMQSVV